MCLCTQVQVPRSSNYLLRLYLLIDEGTQRCLVFTLKRDKKTFPSAADRDDWIRSIIICLFSPQSTQTIRKELLKKNLFTNMFNCSLFWSYGPASSRAHKIIFLEPDLILVTNITNYIHGEKLSCGEISACITVVGKFRISPHVEKFQMSPHERFG